MNFVVAAPYNQNKKNSFQNAILYPNSGTLTVEDVICIRDEY